MTAVSTRRASLFLVALSVIAAIGVGPGAARDGAARDGASQGGGPAGEVSWSVEPVRRDGAEDRANFVFEAEPGDTIEDALVVRNLGGITLVLGVYASDAFNTADGGIDLLAGREEPEDLGSWVTVSTTAITVAPGEATEVPFTVTVPSDAASGDHAGGIVTSLTVRDDTQSGTGVTVERRLGTRMHVRVDGELRPALTFKALSSTYKGSLNPFTPGEMVLTYTVENTGNVRLRARRTARVEPSVGPVASDEASDMAELLPGNSYELTQTVTGVWPFGSTSSEVELVPYEPSGAPLDSAPVPAIARTSVTLVPWPQIVLVLLVLAAGAYSWRRRSVRSRQLRVAVAGAVREAMAAREAGGTTS